MTTPTGTSAADPMTPEQVAEVRALPAVALSVRQPWAWSIFYAGKDIENRDWPTRYRGSVLIHASKGMTRDEYEDCLDTHHHISRTRPFPEGLTMPAFNDLPRGGIVGVVDIVDCVEESDSPWFFGSYGFVLKNARPLKFLPCKGALGFFRPAIDVAALQFADAYRTPFPKPQEPRT